LARVDSRELTEWQVYYSIRPFGERLKDMRMARICSTMANAWKSKGSPISDDEFMFKFGEQNTVDEDSLKSKLKSMGFEQWQP